MKEDAGKVGPLADLEILLQLLDGVDDTLKAGQQVLAEAAESVEERKKRNNQLKQRMKNMRGDMANQLNQIMGSLGVASEGGETMSEGDIQKALNDAFVKFDRDNSGWLGFTEVNLITFNSSPTGHACFFFVL